MPAHVIEVPCHSIFGLRQSYNYMCSGTYYLIIGALSLPTLNSLCLGGEVQCVFHLDSVLFEPPLVIYYGSYTIGVRIRDLIMQGYKNRVAESSGTDTPWFSTGTKLSLVNGYRYPHFWYWYQFPSILWVPIPTFGTGTDVRVLPRKGRFFHFSPTKTHITLSKLMYLITHHGILPKQL